MTDKTENPEKIVRSDAEWRTLLSQEQYQVLRQKGTERPFTGALTQNHETGDYHCARLRGASCSSAEPSSTPAAAGRASCSPPTPKPSASTRTEASA